jgi:hypothetical protein
MLQKKRQSEDAADYLIEGGGDDDDDDGGSEELPITKSHDISQLSKAQKRKLLVSQSPELPG